MRMTKRRRKRAVRPEGRRFLFEEVRDNGFCAAFHAHIEELAYEMLKDPEYREWMDQQLEELFTSLAAKIRERRKAPPRVGFAQT